MAAANGITPFCQIGDQERGNALVDPVCRYAGYEQLVTRDAANHWKPLCCRFSVPSVEPVGITSLTWRSRWQAGSVFRIVGPRNDFPAYE
ncbi:hypothetical protein R1flu_003367 [Riccia fluitans]|uniref:Uncharacterized protein n=1 Tax=Riccia fluitans TaxID=41844 RepID=A0ABD1YCA1_9MARC